MPIPRLICPHCHTPVDPAAMDTARSAAGEWHICPACDEPMLFHPAPVEVTRDREAASAIPAPVEA